MLRLRALGTSGSQVIGQFIQSQPYRYEVIGLPTGSGAMLARLAGVWKVLRTERGKSAAWTGSFVTAEDALASIDEPSGCGPLLIPIIAAKVLA
jgi:hypothetical protein